MLLGGFRRALAFLTPVGGATAPAPDAVAWFPVVGALLGLVVGGWWWLAAKAWPAPVVAALVVAADLGLTGMLHFDGVLDCADGLLSHLGPDQRLAVMASPEVGAFAVAVGGTVLVTRWASLASLSPAPALIAGLWCASRTLMAVVLRSVPYARGNEGGLATSFLGAASGGKRSIGFLVIGAGFVASLALAASWRIVAGPAAVLGGTVAGIGVVLLGCRRLGGFTGDVLGAAGVVAETVGLVIAAAKW
jgi:adenosylcobinamide-GDP ribazoletransferase